MLKYRMNLVKSVRLAEQRNRKHKMLITLLLFACFSVLAAAAYHTYLRIGAMEGTLETERRKLRDIEAEYHTYQSTQETIDKADIELLNDIQQNRVYWTRILEAMASHLPEEEPTSYWITRFGFAPPNFTVSGFGHITERQEQLLALDEYLGRLRGDPNYSQVFGTTSLRSTVRSDEGDRERVSFDYASTRRGGR
jgi:Tfp pilus assembly protein PilN